ICGETGSGKSTQLPKICLQLGRGVDGLIGHTQPRRIAARSLATRIAEELRAPLGTTVGFQVRFTDQTGPQTLVKLMTDGILLAETQRDRFLDAYDTLIIDEAHERSLNIDFLMGYLKQLLPRRPDLKLIITSATIDAERFAQHFETTRGPAPVLQVSGRMYPVEVRYRPVAEEDSTDEPDWEQAIVSALHELAEIDTGDALVFLPTERDIHELAKRLRGEHFAGDGNGRRTEILPLYARLPASEQARVFTGHPYRRIVLATNVAESSLTVPGIRYVVDPGTARISRYSARSKMQRLPIEPISQASANQRSGRCGRMGPGVCIRLYSEADFLARERFTPPEVQRTSLASVILQLKALDFGGIEEFPFLDPPKTEAIRDGYKTLFELGALDAEQRLTDLGRRLSRLPLDPRVARIVLAGDEEGCLSEILIIAAALELQDPRERPLEKQHAADECHARFSDEESDFCSYLKLWDFYEGLRGSCTRNQLRRACRQNFLSYNRIQEW
ncbi:MAG: ATP-dependent RNA helicase HrpA, partial [Planctomycetaceae bacterium]